MYKMKKNILRYLTFLMGILIMTLGVSLTVKSGLGAGSYDSINFAIAYIFHINVSIGIYATALLIVFITAFIRKSRPRFQTFIPSVIMGITTDIWVRVIKTIPTDILYMRIFIFIAGALMVSLGIAMYMTPKLPTNPTDDLMVALTEKKFSITKSKLGIDILCFVIAFILKGPIGVGTVILTLAIGPTVDIFYHGIDAVLKNFQVEVA
ncbi:hypothetical protein CPJCM30710_18120 [Clostridium polyendosporum]|uniref:Membrane protein YczE n=2 Tax=Clostridium polyendosporum TaxID=69208 RepID=A0A919VGZ4_9CLOT|nr:hypothetical protein CPJCM30710_18120 [Clostridium polyendosporum]